MSRRHYVNNAAVVTLTAGINSSVTSCTVTSAATFPASTPWTACINAGQSDAEVVLVTAVVGSTLTITRAYDGTAGQSHSTGATFAHVAVKADYDEANDHVNKTTGVHGVAGAVVGDSDTQTLSNKTLTSPVITGGTISAATFVNIAEEDGDLTHPAIKAKATVAGGKLMSLLDHSGTEKASVSDAGDAVFAGSVTAASVHGQGAAQPGMVTMWGGVVSSPPAGWLSCNGTAVLRSTYAALFAVIGTRFGAGDGSTTFNLPNVDGSFPFGTALDAGVGVAGGAASHTHTLSNGWAEVSAGTSTLKVQTRSATSWTDDVAYKTLTTDTPGTTHSIGAQLAGATDSSVAALPPYVTFGFIIKY